jgi:acetyl-CoA carboxylase biotin carboxyl carrier protein
MSPKEIQDLLKLVTKLELSEFKLKDGEFSMTVRTQHYVSADNSGFIAGASSQVIPMPAVAPAYSAPPAAPAPVAPSTPDFAPSSNNGGEEEEDTSNYLEVKSPMVGTFYRSPSPDKPIYVKTGDTIAVGDTVCIIEAMKLFNEVDAEISGKIVKVMVEDAQPVEYDQVLFLVDPKG